MNKTQLIEAVSTVAGLSKSDASKAVDAVFSNISNALQKGDSVSLVGFGTFKVVHRPDCVGLNPRSGESIQIPAHNSPTFKAGKGLKDAVK